MPAIPIYYGYQVQESPRHGNVSDVCRPHLVWPCYLHAGEQVRVNLMARCRLAGPGATVDGPEPHYPHESADTFPVDAIVLAL